MSKFIEKCVFCGAMPKVIHYDENMWYVQCRCDKHQKYEYLGCDEEVAIDRWNFANRKGNFRKQEKRTKNED